MSTIRKNTIILCIILFALLSSGCIGETTTEAPPTTTPTPTTVTTEAPKIEILDIPYDKFNSLFGEESKLTDAEKDIEWKKYEGKAVKWTGWVVDVNENIDGGYSVTFKHYLGTETFDTIVDFDENLKDKLTPLKKDDFVTYTGRLVTKSGAVSTTSLTGTDIEY